MSRRKVHGGTPTHFAPSMCETCSSATIIRGETLDQEIVQCSVLGRGDDNRITFKVMHCNSYTDARLPSIYEMRQMAWEIRTDRAKGIGFVSPRERAKDKEWRDDPLYDPLKKEVVGY